MHSRKAGAFTPTWPKAPMSRSTAKDWPTVATVGQSLAVLRDIGAFGQVGVKAPAFLECILCFLGLIAELQEITEYKKTTCQLCTRRRKRGRFGHDPKTQ